MFIPNVVGHFYGVHVVDAEMQNIAVVDGVYDGVGVELVAEACGVVLSRRLPPLPAFWAKMGVLVNPKI